MLMHANHLEREYGAGPHTLSVPRMRPADGSDVRAARAGSGGSCVQCSSATVVQPLGAGSAVHAHGALVAPPPGRAKPPALQPSAAPHPQVSLAPPYVVNDADFKKLVAILRIAVPYTGMILRRVRERGAGWSSGNGSGAVGAAVAALSGAHPCACAHPFRRAARGRAPRCGASCCGWG